MGQAALFVHFQQLDFKYQSGVRGNHTAGTVCAVTHFRRDGQLAFAAFLHAAEAFVPTFDNLSDAERDGRAVGVGRGWSRIWFRFPASRCSGR